MRELKEGKTPTKRFVAPAGLAVDPAAAGVVVARPRPRSPLLSHRVTHGPLIS